jgi:hypothetical protein
MIRSNMDTIHLLANMNNRQSSTNQQSLSRKNQLQFHQQDLHVINNHNQKDGNAYEAILD